MPCLMRGAQAVLSPIFGAPATPVPWHATQFASKIALPFAAPPPAAACGAGFEADAAAAAVGVAAPPAAGAAAAEPAAGAAPADAGAGAAPAGSLNCAPA